MNTFNNEFYKAISVLENLCQGSKYDIHFGYYVNNTVSDKYAINLEIPTMPNSIVHLCEFSKDKSYLEMLDEIANDIFEGIGVISVVDHIRIYSGDIALDSALDKSYPIREDDLKFVLDNNEKCICIFKDFGNDLKSFIVQSKQKLEPNFNKSSSIIIQKNNSKKLKI